MTNYITIKQQQPIPNTLDIGIMMDYYTKELAYKTADIEENLIIKYITILGGNLHNLVKIADLDGTESMVDQTNGFILWTTNRRNLMHMDYDNEDLYKFTIRYQVNQKLADIKMSTTKKRC